MSSKPRNQHWYKDRGPQPPNLRPVLINTVRASWTRPFKASFRTRVQSSTVRRYVEMPHVGSRNAKNGSNMERVEYAASDSAPQNSTKYAPSCTNTNTAYRFSWISRGYLRFHSQIRSSKLLQLLFSEGHNPLTRGHAKVNKPMVEVSFFKISWLILQKLLSHVRNNLHYLRR